jgi:thymidylate kinase
MIGTDVFPLESLVTVRTLFTELNDQSVRYCHWKSTLTLPMALAGRTDLDLLVDPQEAERFQLIVRNLGFKAFVSHRSRRFPRVEDFLGFDAASGRLVHLHIYYQLIVGEHYIKNHVLPIEAAFLDEATVVNGVRIPPPALELAVLILRTLLKYRDTDALKDLLGLGRRGGIPPDARAEIDDLRGRTTPRALMEVAERHLPALPPSVFTDFLQVLSHDRRDARSLLRLRMDVRRGLRRYERMHWAEARARYLQARLIRAPILRTLVRGLTRSQLRRKSPLGGGLTVAVVGPDGAGKSTIIEGIANWLGWRLNLSISYLGTARPSPLTAMLQRSSRFAKRGLRVIGRRSGSGPRWLAAPVAVLTSLRYLAEARDRAGRAAKGRRLAAKGVLVLFDRYPLADVRLDGRIMDGPRIATLSVDTERGLLRLVQRAEEAIYRRIPPPDLVLLLDVPPDVALARKPSRQPLAVAQKATAIRQAVTDAGPGVVPIDAGRPQDEVLQRVKDAIWRRL